MLFHDCCGSAGFGSIFLGADDFAATAAGFGRDMEVLDIILLAAGLLLLRVWWLDLATFICLFLLVFPEVKSLLGRTGTILRDRGMASGSI